MAGPGDESAASYGQGRGGIRASRADRERVIELLKDAFVQERLTQDELDARVGLALASRIHAELADLTADIPADLVAPEPAGTPGTPGTPARTPARTLAIAARRAGACMLIPFALVGVVVLTNATSWAGLVFFLGVAGIIAATGFMGYGVLDAWEQRRSPGQLPPRPRRDGRLEGGRSGSNGRDPARTRARTDQNRVDLRAHLPRGIRPVPGAV